MTMKKIKKGDVYYAVLDPVIGSEQDGTRPVVIIQNEFANQYSPVVLVAPITSKIKDKPNLKTHVSIKANGKILCDSIVLLEQIRVLDKTRLNHYLCTLNEEKILEIDKAILHSFEIDINKLIYD